MKDKSLLRFFSLILCFIFVSSVAVSAETAEHIHSEACQYKYVDDIDKYLEQLNAGIITPLNTTITTFNSDNHSIEIDESYMPIVPFWLWTDCSNALGHSWGSWGGWSEVSRAHFSTGTCSVTMDRYRFCSRTNCNSSQRETDSVWVSCRH